MVSVLVGHAFEWTVSDFKLQANMARVHLESCRRPQSSEATVTVPLSGIVGEGDPLCIHHKILSRMEVRIMRWFFWITTC